jgi:DNA processing protein
MTHALHWLALSRLPGIGSVTIRHWLDYFKTVDALCHASTVDLQTAGLTKKQIAILQHLDWRSAEKDLRLIEEKKYQLLTLQDEKYPSLLREIYDAPLILYVRGNVDLLASPQIAMVGSRHPTITGGETARQFAIALARAGFSVTSGLALGVDAASHRGALVASGKTIAILGAGLEHIYPRSHIQLAEEIAESGALVSEFPPNALPKAAHFPMRNRIISGLSLGVVVVEAAVQSGSLITARMALEQNRDVFAIPGSIHNPLARGCHRLIREGATLVETAKDIFDQLGDEIGVLIQTPSISSVESLDEEAVDLDPKLKRILAQIGYEVTAMDVIISRSGLTPSELSSMLLSLELEGYVHSVPGGYVRAANELNKVVI